MKITPEQLKIAQECSTAEELSAKAAEHGIDLSPETAQQLMGASSMTEIDENDLANVSGGCYSSSFCNLCQNHDGTVGFYKKHYIYESGQSAHPDTYGRWCASCKAWYMQYGSVNNYQYTEDFTHSNN